MNTATHTLSKDFGSYGVQVTFTAGEFDAAVTRVEYSEEHCTEDARTMPLGDARIEWRRLARQGYSVAESPF